MPIPFGEGIKGWVWAIFFRERGSSNASTFFLGLFLFEIKGCSQIMPDFLGPSKTRPLLFVILCPFLANAPHGWRNLWTNIWKCDIICKLQPFFEVAGLTFTSNFSSFYIAVWGGGTTFLFYIICHLWPDPLYSMDHIQSF